MPALFALLAEKEGKLSLNMQKREKEEEEMKVYAPQNPLQYDSTFVTYMVMLNKENVHLFLNCR